MLFVDTLRKAVSLGYASCFLREEPVRLSLILISNPESGKSSILTSWAPPNKVGGMFIMNDLTKSKLINVILKNSNGLRYIVVPDFLRVTSHSIGVTRAVMGMLNSGMEEGLTDVTQYLGNSQNQVATFEEPLRFGVATSITRQYMMQRHVKQLWFDTGFFSRFMPLTFDYTDDQIKAIKEIIQSGKESHSKPEQLKLKEMSIRCPSKYVEELDKYIKPLARSARLYGFRYTRQMRVMLKAHALQRICAVKGRKPDKTVTKEDLEGVIPILRYVNMDYNKVV